MNRPVPLLVPDMPSAQEIAPWLERIDAARWYTNFGPLVRRFEQGVADVLEVSPDELVTTANATLGLELSLAALGLARDAKVLVPALTFVASAGAVQRAGLAPVAVDVDPRTWTLTPEIARDALRRHAAVCVMPVAAFGCALDVHGWDRFVEDTGVPVLVDAAGAFGNQAAGRRFAVVYSLHATKAFGVGEGGVVAARDAVFIERVRRMSNFGIDVENGHAAMAGTNAKLSEYHAAVGLAQLARWPARRAARIELHRRVLRMLKACCPGLGFQDRAGDGIYAIFQALLPEGARRDTVAALLAAAGIETRGWYLPLIPEHPQFRAAGGEALGTARALAPRLIGLPFHFGVGDADLELLCRTLRTALDAGRGN